MGRRGILPSMGAGTSLIVAGVLCLALISSIIAFRGFPGLGPDPARPPVRLAVPAADGTDRSAPAPIVVAATTGSATPAAPVRRATARSYGAHADGRAVRIGAAPSSGSGSSPSAPVTDPVAPSPSPSPSRSPSPPAPAATPSTSEPASWTRTPAPTTRPRPVRETVDRVRDVVAPAQPPPTPPAAQPIVDEAAGLAGAAKDVVDQVAGTADDMVGRVLP